MQEQGRFPWSRSKLADLVTKLSDAGVIVIAFDIFFLNRKKTLLQKLCLKFLIYQKVHHPLC
ncbi:CHASE2 domain-containing protein [Pseudoalteromonas sp. B193]